MRVHGSHKRSAGILLIEVMFAVAILAMVTAVTTVCFADIFQIYGAVSRYNRRVAAADFLLESISRDVRSAGRFGAYAVDVRSGKDVLILRSAAYDYVVYRPVEKGIERVQNKDDKKRTVLLGAPEFRVSFDFEGQPAGSARSVLIHVEWDEPLRLGMTKTWVRLRVALRKGGAR